MKTIEREEAFQEYGKYRTFFFFLNQNTYKICFNTNLILNIFSAILFFFFLTPGHIFKKKMKNRMKYIDSS